MGSQNCRQQQYTLDLADKSRIASKHKHVRNACVDQAGNNQELLAMGIQNCRQQQYALDLADKSRRQSAPRAHNLTEVSAPIIRTSDLIVL